MKKEDLTKLVDSAKQTAGTVKTVVKTGVATSKKVLNKKNLKTSLDATAKGAEMAAKGARLAAKGTESIANTIEKASSGIKKLGAKLKR